MKVMGIEKVRMPDTKSQNSCIKLNVKCKVLCALPYVGQCYSYRTSDSVSATVCRTVLVPQYVGQC